MAVTTKRFPPFEEDAVLVPRNGNRLAKAQAEVGATGLRIWYGRTDEEWLPALKWEKRFKVWREMADNDPTIGGMLRAQTVLARQVEWHVEHEDDTDPRIELMETAKEEMQVPWSDFVTEALYGILVFGWSLNEIVYRQLKTGQIGWEKFAPRAQESLQRWVYRDEQRQRGLVAMEQRPAPTFDLLTIPLAKAIHVRSESRKDNPEGVSILRNCYRPWYFKKHMEQIEAIGIERDLAGLPVLWCPANFFDDSASANETATLEMLKTIAVNIRRDEQEGVVMPLAYDEKGNKMYDLTLLASAGERQFNTNEIITRYDTRMLQTAMADFLQVGHEKTGSFALASSKTSLFAVSLGVYLDQIAMAVNQQAVPDLLELNGLESEDAPRFVHGDIETQDLQEFGTFLSACSAAGMPLFPDRDMENKLRTMLGIPPLSSTEWQEREVEREEREQEQMQQQMDLAGAKDAKDEQPPKEEPPT